jgi:FtsH-binding integral membrane protein
MPAITSWNKAIIAGQTALVTILLILATVFVFRRRFEGRESDALFLLYGWFCWLFALSLGSGLTLYRTEALLLPIAYTLRHLPRQGLLVLLLLTMGFALFMGQLFFRMVLT